MKTLLAVYAYELTGDEIGKLKEGYDNKRHFIDSVLPKYCLHENGTIRRTDDYLYWIESGDEKFLLFNAETLDQVLDTEISGCGGLDELLKDFNIKPLFDKLQKGDFKNFNRGLPLVDYIVIEIIYSSYSSYDGTEYDMDVDVVGYMNGNLEFIEMKADLVVKEKSV